MTETRSVEGSFRDPSGFLYTRNGTLLRQINTPYQASYDQFIESGLYAKLADRGWLVPHEEVDASLAQSAGAYKVIKPRVIPMVTYPYEWSFNQLKTAALLTLHIQQTAFEHGMVLKDASAYNVQFIGSTAIFIDTLSFEMYEQERPWVAYKQFCEHFLAPLALMGYVDPHLGALMQTNIGGISLELASKILPIKAKAKPSLLTHIVLHARTQVRYSDARARSASKPPRISAMGFKALVENLERTVAGLEWRHPKTEWGGYYEDTNYVDEAMARKKQQVRGFLSDIGSVARIVDAGANTGVFSEIAKEFAESVVSLDIDHVAVDRHFLQRQGDGDDKVLPLRVDLTTPSPAIGWRNEERSDILHRAQSDVVMALALIHHLAITNNVPLPSVARMFSDLAPRLIIEFVPKSDSQVERLLATREDIFPAYTPSGFEDAFRQYFDIDKKVDLEGSERSLYLMSRR